MGTALLAVVGVDASAADERCAALVGTRIGPAAVVQAEPLMAGRKFPVEALPQPVREAAQAKNLRFDALEMPEACRVTGKWQTAPGQHVTIEVWLPARWNGKLVGLGGAGFGGGIDGAWKVARRLMVDGYAAIATDSGHEGPGARFAYESLEKLIDFGHRANHVGAQFAKILASGFYGKPVARSYFLGCSNGGRDGLMEASRYPDDYDGVVAGAPAAAFPQLLVSFPWKYQLIHGKGGVPSLGTKLKLVGDAVMKKCDSLDGVKDGVLENPLRCQFDPGELACKQEEGPSCLTEAEISALRKIYKGPHLSSGERVYSGHNVGGEGDPGNWDPWVTSTMTGDIGADLFKWMVYRQPEWDISQFDLDRDYPAVTRSLDGVLRADSSDLSRFMNQGGKLMLYQGWDDPAILAGETLEYWNRLQRDTPLAAAQARLFMVPGMGHCENGPGHTFFDMLPELDRWFETGVAPERIVASRYEDDLPAKLGLPAKVVSTRPLCAWPRIARYKGLGSKKDESRYACK